MGLLSKIFPSEYVEDIYSISYNQLYQKGIRVLIFDIDNTLVPHGKEATCRVKDFFDILKQDGFTIILLSNNGLDRVSKFAESVSCEFIHDAGKPSSIAFKKVFDKLKCDRLKTVMIGDTLFTDIWGANRCGIHTIMVKYIGYYKKEWKGYKRILEKFILSLQPLFSS